MRLFLTSVFIFSLCMSAQAQGELPVDIYTGLPLVQIPLLSVTSHELSDNLRLQYNANGIRVAQPSGFYGLGWNLAGGGMISRQVKGLPDDWTGTGSDLRKGWLYTSSGTTVASAIGAFPATSDTLGTTFDEIPDNSALSSYSYNLDTEPDIFYYNFGNYSGSFVFDNSSTPVVRLMPFADIKVEVTYGSGSENILSFKITTNDGVQYFFDQIVTEKRRTQKVIDTLQYSKRIFSLYDYSRYSSYVTYAAEWDLSKVLSPLGASIQYGYYGVSATSAIDTFRVEITGAPSVIKNIYSDERNRGYNLLSSVQAFTGASVAGARVSLYYNSNNMLSGISAMDSRSLAVYDNFSFAYSESLVSQFPRFYLKSVTESNGCSSLPPYQFHYQSDPDSGPTLPGPYSRSVDFWGYFNGKRNSSLFPTLYYYPVAAKSEQIRLYPIPGYTHSSFTSYDADRTVDPVSAQSGVLQSVSWPSGGSTILNFESHKYFDPVSGTDQYGGGLRIQSVTYFDGVSSAANISKNYVYTDSLGRSSGRLISRPVFAVPTMRYKKPGNGGVDNSKLADWSYMMVRTDQDLSSQETTDGSPVGYQEVKVYRAGAGYVRYQYLMPGTYGSAATGSWSPTTGKIARSTNISTGIITNGGPWIYPYSQNPNYNHERGLVWLRQEYSESGRIVRRTRTYYQSLYKGSANYVVSGLSYDFLPNSGNTTFFFGKYGLLTEVAKTVSSETVTTYDASDKTKFNTASTAYTYGTGPHRLLTQATTTGPDGTKYLTQMKYPLDYGTVPAGADTPSAMIGLLQTNFRNGSAIEQTSQIQRGATLKYTGAKVTLFNDFGTGTKVIPKYSYTMSLAAPLDPSSFSPSRIDPVSKTFVTDSHYEVATTTTSIDSYGNPQSSVGMNMQSSTVGYSYINTLPNVVAANADYSQIGFIDFESPGTLDFTVGGPAYYGTGHTGLNALYPQGTLSKTVTKAPVPNYVVSFWINSSPATTFTIQLQYGSPVTTVNSVVSIPGSGGAGFTYFSKVIAVGAVTTGASMTLNIIPPVLGTVGASSPGLLPVIDDVAFYPASATLTSKTYTIPFGASASTSGNQTVYTVFDALGRKKYVKDKYNNILEKDTYSYPSIVPPVLTGNFTNGNPSNPTVITDGTVIFVGDPNTCLDAASAYQWQVDSSTPVSGSATQSLTIPIKSTNPSTTTVKLVVSNPAFSNITTTKTYTQTLAPINVTVCAAGAQNVKVCSSSSSVVVNAAWPAGCNATAPGNVSGTTFAVYSRDHTAETVTNCSWYKRVAGTSAWGSPVQSTSGLATYTIIKTLPGDNGPGYELQCTVSTSTNSTPSFTRTGTSPVISIVVTQSCP